MAMQSQLKQEQIFLFDDAYYLAQNSDVAAAGLDALTHFMEHGIAELRDFSPLFDKAFYARENPDVIAAGVNVIEHFFEHGVPENRAPSQFFDPAYYNTQNPDVVAAGVSAFEHFLSFGAAEGRDPNGFFDMSFYNAQNPDVVAAVLNPLEHFVRHGIAELRDPNASFDMDAVVAANSAFSDAIASGNAPVFLQVIKDASEVMQIGGTIAQALSVAGTSAGDPSVVPALPEAPVEETVEGGEEVVVVVGGGSSGGGGGGTPSPISPLSLSESAGVLSVSGNSATSTGVVMNVATQSVLDNGIPVPLGSGSYVGVTSVDGSSLANSGLNLVAVRTGVATTVTGSGFADTLNGGTAADNISGGNAADVIDGDAGNDTIDGGNGADVIDGGADDDSITGADGADVITTGTGTDTIVHDGATNDLDIVIDFTGAADVISSALAASAFTYLPATFRLVSNADNSQGLQFTTAASVDNTTGLHQQEFDVTNSGAGGGKFMSEIDDSAGVTGSTGGDYIYLAGTTSGKTVAAGAGADRLIDTTTNANVLQGEGGNDTLSGSGGADTFTGGADSDTFISTFGSGTDDGLDAVTDFTGADDTLEITLAAGSLTYISGTNALVSVAEPAQGFRFVAADGASDNGTGLDDVNFNETNTGAGGGKIMSMVDNSGGLTGTGNSDFLYFAGTTSGKTIDAGGGVDNILDDSGNGNTINGDGGADTIDAGAGADVVTGGNGADTITLGADADTLVREASAGLDIVIDFTGADDTISFAEAASLYTYVVATNSLVLASNTAQGVRFTDAAGADNGTGFDDVEFDETNAGAGGGKFMSENNNSGGLNGSTGADLLYLTGTTSARAATGNAGDDRVISDSANANTLEGSAGDDTLVSGAGSDSVDGGTDNDILTLGAGADHVIRAASDGLDIITDFTSADDTLNFNENAALYTYVAATNSLILVSDATQGVRFRDAAGADNATGLEDAEFDETNVGAGGGKFVSEINNSAGVTGSAAGDLIYLAGTTSGKTVDAGASNDRIIDDSANGNTLNGEGGDDTILGGAGNDAIAGGVGADSLTGGEGQDTFTVASDGDTIVLTETTKVLDTILVTTNAGIGSTVTDFDVSNAGTDDQFTFTEAAFINGNNGTKADVGVGASAGAYDVDSANFMGVVTVTDNTIADFSDAHTVIAAALANEAATDAFIIFIDNGTDTRVISWDDQAGSGGNNDGIVDSAELSVIATLTGFGDVSALTTDNIAIA
jgi:Ca2+-binding RTX toxin-like protein